MQATANENFKFKGWYIGETEISTENPYTYEVEKEITITAKFEFDGILISKITFEKETVSLGKNSTEGIQLKYTIEPDNATNKDVVWDVSDPTLLTVTNGKIVAKGTEGQVKVICKALYGGASVECTVKILDGTFIYTRADLEAIKRNKSGKYILMNDIDLSGGNWTPIEEFLGTLDGNGYTIKNLSINTPKAYRTGLFCEVGERAVVKNLKFDNFSIVGGDNTGVLAGEISGCVSLYSVGIADGSVSGANCVGSFYGSGSGSHTGPTSFRDCYSKCSIIGKGYYVAGMGTWSKKDGAYGSLNFERCYFAGDLRNDSWVNGLAPLNGPKTESSLSERPGVSYNSCYYDGKKLPQSFNTTVNKLQTSDFANSANFYGWDFENTWIIKDGYPELRIFVKDK